ncbi:hypothetical protein Y1Q_0011624 [Alligator mississippiensis]|uniref:Uncharacterized protein n=1 Tax=Alligator mississippiensis TaxID=8496 RepID=A0A151M0I0_ALLMI|nr:hypothetical protein Y1Q_0011624 [Alligator mississippiensis]
MKGQKEGTNDQAKGKVLVSHEKVAWLGSYSLCTKDFIITNLGLEAKLKASLATAIIAKGVGTRKACFPWGGCHPLLFTEEANCRVFIENRLHRCSADVHFPQLRAWLLIFSIYHHTVDCIRLRNTPF